MSWLSAGIVEVKDVLIHDRIWHRPELKALLRARGLVVTGNKATLIQRLRGAVAPAPAVEIAPPGRCQHYFVTSCSETRIADKQHGTVVEAPPQKKIRVDLKTLSSASDELELPALAITTVGTVATQPRPLSFASTSSKVTNHQDVINSPRVMEGDVTSVSLASTTVQATHITPLANVSHHMHHTGTTNSPVLPPLHSSSIPRAATRFQSPRFIVLTPVASSSTSLSIQTTPAPNLSHPAKLSKARLAPLSPLFTRPARSSVSTISEYLLSSWLERFWRIHAKSTQKGKILLFDAIAPRLFTSPSHSHQFNAALTFVISRLYFSFSTCEDAGALLQLPQVIDCAPVVSGIWLISLGSGQQLHVIGGTGEVIGTQEVVRRSIVLGEANPGKSFTLRADWSRYIEEVKSGREISLLDLVQTSDPDDYPSGISWACRQTIQVNPELLRIVVSFILSQCTVSIATSAMIALTRFQLSFCP